MSRAQARLHLARHGLVPAEPGPDDTTDVPAVQAAWLLLRAHHARDRGDAEAAAEFEAAAAELDRQARLPLDLRLAVLMSTGRAQRAARLIDEIAARLPAGSVRRDFITQARRAVGHFPPA